MTYNGIVDRIVDNLGKPDRSSTFMAIVKKDIFDTITKLYRKSEPIKKDSGLIAITDVAQVDDVPDDFFIPLEVLFFNADSQRYPVKELQYEEYMRWNPDITTDDTAFGVFDVSSSPAPLIYTPENFDFDGLVGYTFTDTNPQQLVWKPAINGYYQIFYSTSFGSTEITDLTTSPAFHIAFHELIVIDVTIKHLVRRLGGLTDQISLFALQQQIKSYKDERTELLSEFAGFINVNTSTPILGYWDFMNDPSMLL